MERYEATTEDMDTLKRETRTFGSIELATQWADTGKRWKIEDLHDDRRCVASMYWHPGAGVRIPGVS